MPPEVDALMRLIRELETVGKAHMSARIAEMYQPEPVVDLGESGDFDKFMRGIGGYGL